jgi:hypothetical protein
MLMLLVATHHLASIIGDSGFVVSSVLLSAATLLSSHMSTGNMGTRPENDAYDKSICRIASHDQALHSGGSGTDHSVF